jgi:hypothetical protein
LLEPGARAISSFQIGIALRATPGDLVFHHAGGQVKPPRALTFMTVAGCPAKRGMRTDRQRPVVHLQCSVPLEAYSWRLMQNGRVVDEMPFTTDGVSADRRCITLRPTQRLLRNGTLPLGYFFPPFSTFAKAPRGYGGRTYGAKVTNDGTGDMHSEFAIDFNRGTGAKDRGDPVLAAQPGRVIHVDRSAAGDGTVWIRHRGNFMTQYTHMSDIPQRFGDGDFTGPRGARPGATVGLLEVVGRIGDVGAKDAFHLHHRHHRGKANGAWIPIQMAFGLVAYETSRETVPDRKVVKSPTTLRGWTLDRAATLRVTARTPGGALIHKRIRFRVAPADSVPPCDIADCVAGPVRVPLELLVDQLLPPGDYVIRYQATDDRGETGPLVIDDSVVITGT